MNFPSKVECSNARGEQLSEIKLCFWDLSCLSDEGKKVVDDRILSLEFGRFNQPGSVSKVC